MQPSARAETSRPLFPSFRFRIWSPIGRRRRSAVLVARIDSHSGGPGALANHRAEVGVAAVLGAIGLVDAVVDRPVDRLEGDLLSHPGGDYAPGLLAESGPVPARIPSVIGADIEVAIDRDGPDPGRRAVSFSVLAKWRDVQVVRPGDPSKFVFRPDGHAERSFIARDRPVSSASAANRLDGIIRTSS